MLARNSAGVTHRISDADAREIDQLGGKVGFLATPEYNAPQPIRAELRGSDTCTALGITTRCTSPVLAMCRKLVAVGYNPALRLECYRNDALALTIVSIGLGAGLEVNTHQSGFIAFRDRRAASPMRKSAGVQGASTPAGKNLTAGGADP